MTRDRILVGAVVVLTTLSVAAVATERQEQAKLAKAVTLDVTTEEAQKIPPASSVGRPSLILRPAVQARTPERPGTIVVAAAALGVGVEVTRESVIQIVRSSGTFPEGGFATKEELFKDGHPTLLTPLLKGEPVTRGKISTRATISSLPQEDRKAVTIRIDDDLKGILGFFANPGDEVDVILLRQDKGEARCRLGAKPIPCLWLSFPNILAEHVRVLTVDQLPNVQQERVKLPRAVTLDVSTEEAQMIRLGSNVGRLLLLQREPKSNKRLSRRCGMDDGLRMTPNYFCPPSFKLPPRFP
jgi:pilus assembly protein CpaB